MIGILISRGVTELIRKGAILCVSVKIVYRNIMISIMRIISQKNAGMSEIRSRFVEY